METRLSLEMLNNVSEIDIVYRKKAHCKISERPQIATSHDAYEVMLHYWNMDKIDLLEEFKVLYLNRSNRVMQFISISQGGITGTVADPRLILACALKVGAAAMVLVHISVYSLPLVTVQSLPVFRTHGLPPISDYGLPGKWW